MTTKTDPVLSLRNFSVSFRSSEGTVPAVADVDLDLYPGELLALVGESGSGKSALTMGMIGLNRGPGTTVGGRATFGDTDLVTATEKDLRSIRGSEIAVVFQDSLSALNPIQKVGVQIVEMLRLHSDLGRREAQARAVELLDAVGIVDPEGAYRSYPHEFSGGMRQRVMIAMALANDPRVLVADEPTTALDVTIQQQVLRLIKRLQRETGSSVILVTHDLGVVAEVADRVAVMYAGRIVEIGTVDEVVGNPRHPYTRGLLESRTPVHGPRLDRLPAIGGDPIRGAERPDGCAFAPRCSLATPDCDHGIPPLLAADSSPGHLDACLTNRVKVPAHA